MVGGTATGRRRRRWVPALLAGVVSLLAAVLGLFTNLASALIPDDWLQSNALWIWLGVVGLGVVSGVLTVTALLSERNSEPIESKLAPDSASQAGDSSPIHNLGIRPQLIGRDSVISDLVAALARESLLLFGSAGIGKSAVAIEVGYRLTESTRTPNFDYVLFFTARQAPLDIGALLDGIARWTDNFYVMKLATIDEKTTAVRKILSKQRAAIIVDNLETVEDQRVLSFIGEVPFPSSVLVTSRRSHQELLSVRHVELAPISEESSQRLWERETRGVLAASEGPVYSSRIANHVSFARLTMGNPLAIRWAAGQLHSLPAEEIVHQLSNAKGDLFQQMFETTWTQVSTESRNVLLSLILFKTPATIDFALSIAEVDAELRSIVLRELSSVRLLESSWQASSEPRAGLHPLTQAFVGSKVSEQSHAGRRSRYTALYVALAQKEGGRDWDDPAPFRRIDAERENCLQAATYAFEDERWSDVLIIADYLRNYLLIYGYWRQRHELCRLAIRAAERLGNDQMRGRFLRHIGWTLVLQGKLDEASSYLQEALEKAVESGDVKGQADAIGDKAEILRLRGDLAQARVLRRQALHLSEVGGNGRDIYVEQTLLAQLDLEEGAISSARDGFERSLRMAQELHWHRAIAYCLHWLAEVARLDRDFALAHSYLHQSRRYLEQFHDRARLALVLKSEALLASAEGREVESGRLAAEAAREIRKLGLWYELRLLEPLLTTAQSD